MMAAAVANSIPSSLLIQLSLLLFLFHFIGYCFAILHFKHHAFYLLFGLIEFVLIFIGSTELRKEEMSESMHSFKAGKKQLGPSTKWLSV